MRVAFILLLTFFTSSNGVKLIIDTDGIFDDIRALTIALNNPNVEVLAITTTHGGVDANQSAANVARLMRATNNKNIPLYIGQSTPIVPEGPVEVWEDLTGFDGLGGVPKAWPEAKPSDWTIAQNKSAIDALIEITKAHNDIVLVCLGPLTNFAKAIQRDPEIVKRLRKVVLMGGNYLGVGNSRTNSTAEFNFLMDPEAAYIVLRSVHTIIVPWDTCFFKGPEYALSVNFEESLYLETPISNFLRNITARARKHNKEVGQQYSFVDDVAVGIAIDGRIAKKTLRLFASVDLSKVSYSRGQVTIDWLSTVYHRSTNSFEADSEKNANGWLSHEFVTDYNVDRINELLIDAASKNYNDPQIEKREITHKMLLSMSTNGEMIQKTTVLWIAIGFYMIL